MSLSQWFRDYIYIPLGGNRVSTGKHIRNLLIVWFLTGLWHGAAWNFVAWGLYYGLLLIFEKYVLNPVLDKAPGVIRHLYSIVFVLMGWVLFFSPSLGGALSYIGTMFGSGKRAFMDRQAIYLMVSNLSLWILLIVGSTPIVHTTYQKIMKKSKKISVAANGVVYVGLFVLCIAYLVTETYNPFLYFRF